VRRWEPSPGAAALSCDFRTFQVYPKDLRALSGQQDHALRGCNEGDQHHPDRVKSAGRARSLVIVAAAEAANQVSYSEGNGGSRVWALLYGCAKEVLSPAGAFANSFHGIRRRLLRLSVDILHCTFHLFCLALELTFYVAGSSSEFSEGPRS